MMKLSDEQKSRISVGTRLFWRLGGIVLLVFYSFGVIYGICSLLAPPEDVTAMLSVFEFIFNGASVNAAVSAIAVACIFSAHLSGEMQALPQLRAATSLLTAKLCVRLVSRGGAAVLLKLTDPEADGSILKMGAMSIGTVGSVLEFLLMLAFLCAGAATVQASAARK